MKKAIIITMATATLFGCGPKAPLRTGSVCIPEINTRGYTTSDPVDIRQDVIDKTAEMLRKFTINYLGDDTAMKYSQDCDTATYMLAISLNRLDPETKSKTSYWTKKTTTKRKYTAGASSVFKKGDEVIKMFDVSEDREGLDDTLNELAESIVKNIKRQ